MAVAANVIGGEASPWTAPHDMQEVSAEVCGRDRERSGHGVRNCGLRRIVEAVDLSIGRGRRLCGRVLNIWQIEVWTGHIRSPLEPFL